MHSMTRTFKHFGQGSVSKDERLLRSDTQFVTQRKYWNRFSKNWYDM